MTSPFWETNQQDTLSQVIRFHLLHTDPSEAVLLRMYFPKTQRYDISVDGVYIPPTNIDNSKYPAEYQLLPENDLFLPSITDVSPSHFISYNPYLAHLSWDDLIIHIIIIFICRFLNFRFPVPHIFSFFSWRANCLHYFAFFSCSDFPLRDSTFLFPSPLEPITCKEIRSSFTSSSEADRS